MGSFALKISESLTLPADAVTETFAILGRRGSGKTHTAVVMAEEMLRAGVPIVVIDPLDVWWGLRVDRGGDRQGAAIYIAGGEHGDVPISGDSGKLLADVVVDRQLSMVMSLRQLSKSDQRRFVGEFCERLYERKGTDKHRTPLHVFIDEADAFVPQRLVPGSERCFGAVDTLVRRGRSSGLAPTLISQRPQVINKDVLSQTEVIICHQLTGPQDRAALKAWTDAHDTAGNAKPFMDSIASLPRGTSWVWSPGMLDIFQRVQIRDRYTYDSSSTPKMSDAVRAIPTTRQFAKVDLDALTKEIEACTVRAKQDDPKALHARIAELEKQIATRPAPPRPDILSPDTVEKFKQMQAAAVMNLQSLEGHVRRLTEGLRGAMIEQENQLRALINGTAAAVAAWSPKWEARGDANYSGVMAQALGDDPDFDSPRPGVIRRVGPSEPSTDLPKGEERILAALVQGGPMPRQRVGILTGFKRSTRDRYLQYLQSKGFVFVNGNGDVGASAAGVKMLGPHVEALPTGSALYQHWRQRLPDGEAKILEVVWRRHGAFVNRDFITEKTDYKRSTRDRYVQYLQARGLVQCAPEGVRAAEELYD